MSGAERVFYEMGYRSTGRDSLMLDGQVDHDKITTVARDCILAYVECQVRSNGQNVFKRIRRMYVLKDCTSQSCSTVDVVECPVRSKRTGIMWQYIMLYARKTFFQKSSLREMVQLSRVELKQPAN